MITSERIRDSDEKTSVSSNTDEKSFAEQVDDVLAGKGNRYNDLKVCDTPQILLDIGCEQLPMLYTQNHLKKAILPKNSKLHQHGLSVEQIKELPEKIAEPVMLIESSTRKDSIVIAILDYDSERSPVIVSIKPNGTGQLGNKIRSNFITSVYGRENFIEFISRAIAEENILFWDKIKSQEMFSVLGLQFPKGLNNLDSNVIIHQSRNIVNTNCGKTENTFSENQVALERVLDEVVKTADKIEDAIDNGILNQEQQRESEQDRGAR